MAKTSVEMEVGDRYLRRFDECRRHRLHAGQLADRLNSSECIFVPGMEKFVRILFQRVSEFSSVFRSRAGLAKSLRATNFGHPGIADKNEFSTMRGFHGEHYDLDFGSL